MRQIGRLVGVALFVGAGACGVAGDAGITADGGAPEDAGLGVKDAPADSGVDGGAAPEWAPGQLWNLSFEVVETDRHSDVEDVDNRLSAGVILWVSPAGEVWARLPGLSPASKLYQPEMGPDGTMAMHVSVHDQGTSLCSWTSVNVDLALRPMDLSGDGIADTLSGTASGGLDWQSWDVIGEVMDFEALVTGTLDTYPPHVSIGVQGRWPTQSVRITTFEPVCAADLEVAVSVTVGQTSRDGTAADGVPVAADVAPAQGYEGPPGCATRWQLTLGEPLAAGSELTVAVGPVPDLAGNLSEAVSLTRAVPPLPAPIAVPWDFSQGDPFIGQDGGFEIVDSYGSVQAPTGGAMARVIVGVAEESRLTVAIPTPAEPANAVVTLAVAGEGSAIEMARPRLWVRSPSGERKATVELLPPTHGTGGALTPSKEGVTPFAKATIALDGVPAGVALLDVGLEASPVDLCGGAQSYSVKLLIDRIDVVPTPTR